MNNTSGFTRCQDHPLIYSVFGNGNILYFSEIRAFINPLYLDELQASLTQELIERQQAFLNIGPIQNIITSIGELFFCPEEIACRIRLYVQDGIENNDPHIEKDYRLRVQLWIRFNDQSFAEYGINLTAETKEDDDNAWMSAGVDLIRLYTPCLIKGIRNLEPYHQVQDNPSFYFPFQSVEPVELKKYSSENGWVVTESKELLSESQLLSHYERFCDEVMIPTLRNHYRDFCMAIPELTPVSSELIESQLSLLKENILGYSKTQFFLIKQLMKEENVNKPMVAIAVMIREPNLENPENQFLVFEYVLLTRRNIGFPVRALTTMTSGPVRFEHINKTNVIPMVSNKKH